MQGRLAGLAFHQRSASSIIRSAVVDHGQPPRTCGRPKETMLFSATR